MKILFEIDDEFVKKYDEIQKEVSVLSEKFGESREFVDINIFARNSFLRTISEVEFLIDLKNSIGGKQNA